FVYYVFISNPQAISQRKCDAYFKIIEEQIENIKYDLVEFFNRKIRNHFKSENYTVDLYRESSDDGKMRIQIIDFNVFGPPTEALLFQWSELENDVHENDTIPLFRYQSDQNIRPNSVNQYSVPIDLIDIASGSDPVKVMDFIQAVSPETYSYSSIVFHINSTNVNLCY
ncbi:unnamed protein product, partial [Schistosoma curassoni]|uniref:Cell division cycle protein 123 homolog n=1 Tax=Schistosoma curassoni TaxID=6186 RepID=A0A183KGL1_9TREM